MLRISVKDYERKEKPALLQDLFILGAAAIIMKNLIGA